jgi:hypothetical protein
MLSLYERFSMREKTLMVIFIWGILLFWGTKVSTHLSKALKDVQTQTKVLRNQADIISREGNIDLMLKEQQKKYQGKTYNKNQLFERIEQLATRMKPTLSTSQTQRGEIFNVHTVPVRFRDEPMALLMDFGEKLSREPFISLEKARVQADKKDPRKLDAVFEITSFELNQ